MRNHKEIVIVFILIIMMNPAVGQSAEPSCPETSTGKPAAISGKEAWDLALDRARKWAQDVTLFGFVTISPGLDKEGKSTKWYAQFHSESKQAVDLITIQEGKISCYSHAGSAGRLIPIDDQVSFDTKRFLEAQKRPAGTKFPV